MLFRIIVRLPITRSWKEKMNNNCYVPHVSVIIPVFKPDKAIIKCINSLLRQSLKEVEFIFVDDCGNDGSMEFVYEAAKTDNRIIIVNNEENIGPGESRNKGIEIARGDYISFVDSDDMIADDFLALLYKKASESNADVICGKVVCLYNNGEINTEYNDQWRIDYIKAGLESGKPFYTLLNSHHVSAIYSRDLIVNSNSRYGKTAMGEDLVFLIKVLDHAKILAIEEKAIYYYYEDIDSLSHRFSDKTVWNDYYSFKELLEYMNENMEFDENAANFICDRIHNLLRNIALGNITKGVQKTSKEVLKNLVFEIKTSHIMDIIDSCSMEVKTLALYGYNLLFLPPSGLKEDTTFLFYLDAVERTMEFARANQNCKNVYRYFGMNSLRDTLKFIRAVNEINTRKAKMFSNRLKKLLWSPQVWFKNGIAIQKRFIDYYNYVVKENN